MDNHDLPTSAQPPPPPPLPQVAAVKRPLIKSSTAKDSAMRAKFAAAASGPSSTIEDTRSDWEPRYYFFYGSLMDPEVFQAVTGLPEKPKLLNGWIEGFEVKMWGIYPALVPQPDSRVAGLACWIEEYDTHLKLQRYETRNYVCKDCVIHTQSGETLQGSRTFCWAGDRQSRELQDGPFDFDRYQRHFKPSLLKGRSGPSW